MQRDASRMALAALHRAGIERPDAIIASTALGCLDDTERFLADMHDAAGALLSPLPFMRSTHNTVAGQLALMLRCDGPNITHAQGMHGFHASMVETMLMLHEHPEWRILLIAIDERTELLERVVGALDPAVRVDAGGDAFVLTAMAQPDDVACINWLEANGGAPFAADASNGMHGSLVAQLAGETLSLGARNPLRIASGAGEDTDLLIAPC